MLVGITERSCGFGYLVNDLVVLGKALRDYDFPDALYRRILKRVGKCWVKSIFIHRILSTIKWTNILVSC